MVDTERTLEDVNDFCEKLRPIEDVCYLEHKFNDQTIPLAKEFNILGLPVPEEFNGRGANNFGYIKALERIGMEGSGIRTIFSVHTSLAQKTLMKFGTDEQKERYLKPSAKGEIIFAFALTEPDAGSNPLELRTNFKKDGDSYILNGTKYLISNANIADAIIIFAKSTSNVMGAFMIDTDKEGIEMEELVSKMGTPTTNTGMFELMDYRVPKENVLGKEGDGWQIAKEALIDGRLGILDIKTSQEIYRDYNLQTSAYMAATKEIVKGLETRWILRIDQSKKCMHCGAILRSKGGKDQVKTQWGNPFMQACVHEWGPLEGRIELQEFPYWHDDYQAFLGAKKLWEWENVEWLKKVGYL